MKYQSLFCAASMALLMAGCAVGPDYQRPASELPTQYPEALATDQPAAMATRDWWKLFNDPVLDDLVARAYARNYDLQKAAARIEETSGLLREARAGQFPEVDLGANVARKHISELTDDPPSPGTPLTTRDYNVSLRAAFELDFWGRLRRASEAARAQALGSEYGKRVVELSLAGAVAQTYLSLRSLDAQLAVSQETLVARDESFTITDARYQGGLVSGLDVEQARGAKAAAEAQIADLRQQRALAEHQLGVLTATPDLTLEAGDLRALPLPPLPPAGLPSDLLNARPDIREAEQQLVVANARIGVAKAALFPTISLTGSVGSESGALADLFKSRAGIWSVGAGLDFPIFAAGKYSARVDQATAQQKQLLASYQQSVLNGFREVRDALTTSTQRAAGESALERQRTAAEETLRLANVRYKAGYSPYIEVLDAQRSLNDATLAYIRNRQSRLATAVDLFKALGGGWQTTDRAAP